MDCQLKKSLQKKNNQDSGQNWYVEFIFLHIMHSTHCLDEEFHPFLLCSANKFQLFALIDFFLLLVIFKVFIQSIQVCLHKLQIPLHKAE